MLFLLLLAAQDPNQAKIEQELQQAVKQPLVMVTWSGSFKLEQRQAAPLLGYVADAIAWKALWTAWRGTELVPEVNFNNAIVVVAVSKDPNRIGAGVMLNAKGDLTFAHRQTLMAFENATTGTYQFALIPKERIKTINGQVIKYSAIP